ncbi:MAG TPA: DNA repair protein RecN [Deltaproteobacteria bacterium]|nr:DNA repair protein RecN [Deltaproteobacteria bacterium]HPR53539.1 DNA repair protein RecN [Deltaproteobacteria bacterium]HXK46124.1 DNA repair protein RecN [Deltaproteobacteria bacterium]
MIEFLKISSMAIFDEIEIEFTGGLNCITGETGAGKSLILDALTLLMGARAGRDLVRPGGAKAVIEALMNVSGREMVLRREISPTGSSRCYVDGKLSTVSSLAEVSSGLINIYGQHDYQDLLNPRQHMRILEDHAGLSRQDVEAAYAAYIEAHSALTKIEQDVRAYTQDREYLEHCLHELKSTRIEEGLEERLHQDLQTALKATDLRESSQAVQDLIYTGSPSVMDLGAQARQLIGRMAHHDPSMENLIQDMDDILARLEDVHGKLRGRMDAYEDDPERLGRIEEQLNTIRELKRKHHTDEAGLMGLAGEMGRKLLLLDESGQSTREAKRALDHAMERYRSAVKDFLEKRRSSALRLSRKINRDLGDLGMPGTDFRVAQMEPGDLDATFFDAQGGGSSPAVLLRGEFLVSTNVGQHVLPLTRIASGGELSRIMLAIKGQQNTSTDATMVFDEVDSGISGQTAFAIARKLKEISGRAQSIVVTHLHQVASVADTHLVITKAVHGKTTSSTLERCTGSKRVGELARMMGGDDPSRTVIEHARELVSAHEGKGTAS